MVTRNIKKNLAGMEDLLQGVGSEEQARGESTFSITKIDVPLAVTSTVAVTALDTTVFTRARLYNGSLDYIDLIYDATATDGIASDAVGFWVLANDKQGLIFKGLWTDLTGLLAADKAVGYDGRLWLSTKSIVDITASTPSSTNTDWQLIVSVVHKNTMRGLQGFTGDFTGQEVRTAFFHSMTYGGGATWDWDSTKDKALHNGVNIVDPDNTADLLLWDVTQQGIWFTAGTGTGCWVRRGQWYLTVEQCGVKYDEDYSTVLQPVLDSLGLAADNTGTSIQFNPAFVYTQDNYIVVNKNTTLNYNSTKVNVNSTDWAVILGNSDTVLTYRAEVLNFRFILSTKTSTGVLFRGAAKCRAIGYVEGFTAIIDNTRTNIGVHVDGRDISAFGNHIEVHCNHLNKSFLINTTGTTHPTDQNFVNCFALGDQTLDDSSVGYEFGFGAGGKSGQGSTILGGNIELCNTGILASADAGHVTVLGTRFEINVTGTSWKLDFVDGCEPWTLVGLQGIDTTYMDTSSGIRNFDSAKHTIIGLDAGEARFAGYSGVHNAETFMGIGGAAPKHYYDANATVSFLMDSTASGTGKMQFQAGLGSAAHGGGFAAFAGSHATYPGEFHAFPTAGSPFRVVNGKDGSDRLVLTTSELRPGADNTIACGSGSFRFTEFFGINGVINTSDARLKTLVSPLRAEELKASISIAKAIGGWQWLAKVTSTDEYSYRVKLDSDGEPVLDEQGNEVYEKYSTAEARIHYGPTVQAVMTILIDNDIDPFTRSFICYDEWEDEISYRPIETTVGGESSVLLDKEGEPILEAYVSRAAGNIFSLRKDELVMFIIAGLVAMQEDMSNRLALLEAK